jgi:hypothetical protein
MHFPVGRDLSRQMRAAEAAPTVFRPFSRLMSHFSRLKWIHPVKSGSPASYLRIKRSFLMNIINPLPKKQALFLKTSLNKCPAGFCPAKSELNFS